MATTTRQQSRHPVHSGRAKARKTARQLCGVNAVRFSNNCTLIEMTEAIDLPPELQHVADLLSEQPPAVLDLFRYLLVMSMVDVHKAKIKSTRTEEGRHYLTIQTVADDVFEILRPPISMAAELQMREQMKKIIAEE